MRAPMRTPPPSDDSPPPALEDRRTAARARFPPRHAALTMALVAAVLGGYPRAAAADSCTLASLAWMSGTWHDTTNPNGSQERWVVAPGAVLMGSSWAFPPGGKPGFAEIMTVRAEGDAIKMVLRHFDVGLNRAWEERDAPMLFLATQCTAHAAVFEGLGARAGERLTYERNDSSLQITGDFLHEGKPVRVQWHMARVAD
jgi:hypothetical protein